MYASPASPQYPPFMLNKIVEYNSSTSQDIAVSCVKALKAFEHTHTAIYTLTNAPATIAPESQPVTVPTQTMGGATTINKEGAGEQNKSEVSDTAEENPSTQEGPEGIGKIQNPSTALI